MARPFQSCPSGDRAGRLLGHRALAKEGIESQIVDVASVQTSRRRLRRTAGHIDEEMLLRTLLAHKRCEPRACSITRVPSPEGENPCRVCCERKTLAAERVQHVDWNKERCSPRRSPAASPFATAEAAV